MCEIRSNSNSPRAEKVQPEKPSWSFHKPAHKGLRAKYDTEYLKTMGTYGENPVQKQMNISSSKRNMLTMELR